MTSDHERDITAEQYRRAIKNHGLIAEQDEDKIFTKYELIGRGVYYATVYEKNGRYFVRYSLGDSCD